MRWVIVVVALILIGVAIVVVPDLRRYLRLKRM